MNIFHLPDLGEGLAEAEIHEWFVKEGDVVKLDQPMVSVETAKAVVEVPAPQAGKIIKLYAKAGEIVQTGGPLVEFESNENVVQKDKGTVVGSLEESSTILDSGDMIVGFAKQATSTVKAMPAIRALAKQLNVDLTSIVGTGSNGQITAEDVKKAAAPKTKLPGNVEGLHGVRRAMAIAMAQSHAEVVPVTVVEDADITDLPKDADITARLLMAIVAGAKAEPSINAWYDGKTMERCLMKEINIGLAVDTAEGLFVPVIKEAEKCSSSELRQKINSFKESVKSRSISPSDLQGATITLSNFGMITGRYASPIVVPPMVAILGCGKIRDTVIAHNGKMEVRRIMPLSLSFDHRAVTGGEATRFLAVVIQNLEAK